MSLLLASLLQDIRKNFLRLLKFSESLVENLSFFIGV